MFTIHELRMKTEAMMERMRRNAIDATFERFKEAAYKYYAQGYDNGELEAIIKELEELGANMEEVLDADLAIMEEVRGI